MTNESLKIHQDFLLSSPKKSTVLSKKDNSQQLAGVLLTYNHNELKTQKSGEASQATGDLISNFSHPPQALCQGQCDVSSAGYPGAWSLVDGRAFTNLKETEEEKR